jgi:hypothetical protein
VRCALQAAQTRSGLKTREMLVARDKQESGGIWLAGNFGLTLGCGVVGRISGGDVRIPRLESAERLDLFPWLDVCGGWG